MFCYDEVFWDRKDQTFNNTATVNILHYTKFMVIDWQLNFLSADTESKFTLQYTKELRNALALPRLSWA